MKKSIFREKSIDRISSPEEFDQYVKVSNPSVWCVIIAVLIIICGFFVWSIFGRMESIVSCAIDFNEQGLLCYVLEEDVSRVEPGMKVRTTDGEGTVVEIYKYAQRLNSDDSPQLVHALEEVDADSDDVWAYTLKIDGDFRMGIYKGEIVVEEVKPIEFLFN